MSGSLTRGYFPTCLLCAACVIAAITAPMGRILSGASALSPEEQTEEDRRDCFETKRAKSWLTLCKCLEGAT